MIALLLALAFAVHPPTFALVASPGDAVTIPLTMVGDERVRISGSGIIRYEELVDVLGKQDVNVSFRIPASTRDGMHESLLYIAPDTDDPVVPATAVKVRADVKAQNSAHTIPGTQHVLQGSFLPVVLGLLALAVVIVVLASIRVRRV